MELAAYLLADRRSVKGGWDASARQHFFLSLSVILFAQDLASAVALAMQAPPSTAGDASAGGGGERHALTAGSAAEAARHEAMVREFELRRLEREVVVPANVEDVKVREDDDLIVDGIAATSS